MFDGFLNLSAWGVVGATLLMTHVTIIAVTVFLHRHQAHRALDLHPSVSHFFRLWLWLTTGMRTIEWVAIHRKHHAKCDTEDDPHSPQVLGLKKVLWQGAELYRKEAANSETIQRYGMGTPDDWLEHKIYRHSFAGIVVMLIADLFMFGLIGISVWAIQMIWVPFWAAGVINGVGHFWGYRNYECKDASTNLIPWGILIGGEELHNNHHTFGNSAKLSSKWWEFDIGWMYIRILEMLALARVNKVAPTLHVGNPKPIADMDTVKAILANRFQVMSRYTKDVILPACRASDRSAANNSRGWMKKARKILVRNEALLKPKDKQLLSKTLSENETLKLVYQYKQRLQQIWERTDKDSQEPLLKALQDWCKQAEQTGVAMLENFSRNLRGYTLPHSSLVRQ
jgi:stearoyl-CoA desaturase (delta-9 desaturase)